MAFDIEMIKQVYAALPGKIERARELVGRPLTYTEKILYAHLTDALPAEAFVRGGSYVDFDPDRVAMQDATAQMAMLQFMQAGKARTAVPSTPRDTSASSPGPSRSFRPPIRTSSWRLAKTNSLASAGIPVPRTRRRPC